MPPKACARGACAVMNDKAPFPTKQLAVLAMCRICEPIAFMSIFPYVYYMVSSFNVTDDKAQIAMYVGMVTSAFAFAECATGVLWGQLSDRVGRKPVLLGGLAGTGLSMIVFGFAPNLPVALLARALGGLLNGNIGVLQSTVAEVVTVEAHQPRAYSIMPFVWCLGSIIGSGLGGTLAEPVKNYPSRFLPGSIWDTYPYLLPNVVCTIVVIIGLAVGILFLEETHEDKKHERDAGLELGKWILGKLWKSGADEPVSTKDGYFEETLSMLADDGLPAYQTTENLPTLSGSEPAVAEPPSYSIDSSEKTREEPLSWRDAFTKQVILNIVGYGILAFHTISFEQLMPILMSLPESTEAPNLPFKFTGGFAFSTKTIGFILSMQGFLQMIAQIFVFPIISRRLGSLRTFWLVIAAYPFLYFFTPYLALLPEDFRMPGVYLVLAWKVTAQSLAYPSLAIMLANSAPSKKVLGTLNGTAASSASICRGFGPTLSGIVQSTGQSIGYSGLSWWACAGVAFIGWIPSFFMKEERRRPGFRNNEENQDEEAGLYKLADSISDTASDTASVAASDTTLALKGSSRSEFQEPGMTCGIGSNGDVK